MIADDVFRVLILRQIFAVIAKVAILFLGSKDPSATLVIEVLAINFVIMSEKRGAGTQQRTSEGIGGMDQRQWTHASVGGMLVCCF